MKYKLVSTLGILCCCNLFCHSQEEEIRAYLGLTADHLFIAGSFDGTSFFQTDEDIMLVPSINSAFGLGGVMGIGSNRFAVDIGYHFSRSDYVTMEEGFSGKYTNHLIRFLGFTKYLSAYSEGKIKPYFDVDLSVTFQQFDKIAYPIYNIETVTSGRYGGIILGVGFGTLFRLSERLSMDIKILPEYYIGTDIRVKGRDWYAISKFGNFLLLSSVGLKYYSKPF
jgi:hypothetical protein